MGTFTGLAAYFSDSLIVTDACGVRYTQYISPPFISLMELCPFNGNVFSPNINYPIEPDTITFVCLNCSPPQSVTVPYSGGMKLDTLFSHQPSGVNFDIVVLSSACGGDTILHAPVSVTSDIQIAAEYISCRSFQTIVLADGGPIAVDSFVLSYTRYGQSIQSNTTGLFEQLPDSMYVVSAYIGAVCNDTPYINVTIPYFGNGCFTLMKDPTCHNAWEYSTNSLVPERYSLITSPGDTVASSPGTTYNANFYDLLPGHSYRVISDSGCAEQVQAPPAVSPVPSVVAFLPCIGQPVIQFTAPDYTYCYGSTVASPSQIRIVIYYLDSLIFDGYESTAAPVQIDITDSGWYHYTIYAANTADTSAMLRYDTICPIDTGSVYMNNTQIPYLSSSVAFVCGTGSQSDTVYYYVYGGSAPYTIQVPGFDTVTIQTNIGIFPTHQPGSYTMLVYDNCGISRSVSFDIVDTCSGCPYAAIYLPDSFSCAGDTIALTAEAIHAVSYRWIINGMPYSIAKDTSFVSAAGGNTIMLIATSATGCSDTSIAQTEDTCSGCPYVAASVPDTLYCAGTSIPLTGITIGGLSYQWLVNGQLYSISLDTVFVPATAGVYEIQFLATSATACTRSAAIEITVLDPYTINLDPDTTYCGAFSRTLSTGIGTTTWSDGASGSQISVNMPGTYTAQATNICGTASASITLSEKPIPLVNLGDDTTLCTGHPVVLDAGNPGATYEWDNAATSQTIEVSGPGIYAVSVTVNGCTGEDSITVIYISAPVPFDMGADTSICSGSTFLLEAYQPNAYYLWNTGSTNPYMYVTSSGTYEVTDSNKCGKASDTISVTITDCTCLVDIPTAFSPNDDGKNDYYGGIAWCIPLHYTLEIYDRWGQKLFTSYSIDNKWNGMYDNKPQPLGVYVYYMKYTDPYTNIVHTQSGNVTLIR
jgi:gliding motility-associated-like protein